MARKTKTAKDTLGGMSHTSLAFQALAVEVLALRQNAATLRNKGTPLGPFKGPRSRAYYAALDSFSLVAALERNYNNV